MRIANCKWQMGGIAAWASVWVAIQAFGQQPPPTTSEGGASPWQAYFRQVAGEYRLTAGEERPMTLVPEPLLKWSQPVRGGQDGAVFVWLEEGRPGVIGTFFIWPANDGRQGLSHELHVLSSAKVQGDWRQAIRWRPGESPIAWHDLPEASPPSQTQTRRMVEARQWARRFAAVSRNREGQTYELRLQPRPFFEYENAKRDGAWLGGALFSLVQGTDTEVLLWLEAQNVNGSPTWRYALARMSDLQLTVTLDGKEVWTTQFARYDDLTSPYLCMAPEFFREPPVASAEKP